MACWVAPSVAAEYLRLTVEEVYQRVRSGGLSACTSIGLTFVNIGPYLPDDQSPACSAAPASSATASATPEPLAPRAVRHDLRGGLGLHDVLNEKERAALGIRLPRKQVGLQDALTARRSVAPTRRRPVALAA